ncbi:MAG: photosystem II complex extrinsic protein PsbU [Oculatellaceae cyanobacterium Prado106]|jgi:photosystem II PsbU protein|nr:photosystem II complex extrinsic protein PsbU [Oculatellaceae cyanobacterium Prado106]
MKRFIHWIGLVSLIVISCLLLGWVQTAIASPLLATSLPNPNTQPTCLEFGQKIDLNNANIVAFTDCQGFYPTLASLIINNGPYQKVEDVLQIPGLSHQQKELLTSYLDYFTVKDAVVPLAERMPPRPASRK